MSAVYCMPRALASRADGKTQRRHPPAPRRARRPRGPARAPGRPVLGEARRRRLVDPEGRVRGRGGADGGARCASSRRRSARRSSTPASWWSSARCARRTASVVTAWAAEGDLDASAVRSNTFEMEWPPRSGRTAGVPGDRSRRVVHARAGAREADRGAGRVPRPAGGASARRRGRGARGSARRSSARRRPSPRAWSGRRCDGAARRLRSP